MDYNEITNLNLKSIITKSPVIREIREVEAPYVPLWVPVSVGILIACQIAAIIFMTASTSQRSYLRSRAKAAEQALVEQEKKHSIYWKNRNAEESYVDPDRPY